MKKKPIGIMGREGIAPVVTGLLISRDNDVLVWGDRKVDIDDVIQVACGMNDVSEKSLKSRLRSTGSLRKLGETCDIIFYGINADDLRKTLQNEVGFLSPHHIMVSSTKGMEGETLKRMSQIVKEETPVKKTGALAGPCFTEEICRGVPTASVIASEFNEVIEEVRELLNGTTFKVYGSYDLTGVEICGALKNIYAVACGISAGLGYGIGTTAFLLSWALKEICNFAIRFQAKKGTFADTACLGDLMTASMAKYSRDYAFGYLIGKGKKVKTAVKEIEGSAEGIRTVKAVCRYAAKHKITMPIASTVNKIISGKSKAERAVNKLLQFDGMIIEDDFWDSI